MPEVRLNLVTREWVVIATERARPPEDFRQWKEKRYQPERLESCPFCPGNEEKTPDEILRLPIGGTAPRDIDGWKIRVVPNRLAVFAPEGGVEREVSGLRHRVSGAGRHEVIVESPRHDMCIPLLPLEDVSDILKVYRDRFLEVYRDMRVEHVIIFKNNGEASGTTIQHPHSQVVGMPVTPFQVRERLEEATRFFDETGECLMCATLRDEQKDARRIIAETGHFVSFIPFAALSPFHTWLFPKRHSASFSDIEDEEIEDLAKNLKDTLSRLYYGLDNPDYNYVLRSESPELHHSKCFHWYLSIVPRLTPASGFALGTGMYTNNSIPEDIASFLRNVKVP